MSLLRKHAEKIIAGTVEAVRPDTAVKTAIMRRSFSDKIVAIAIGKAALSMGDAAVSVLGAKISRGLIITKYGHGGQTSPVFEIIEAGHPEADENSVIAAKTAVELVCGMTEDEELLLLVSGGGSALFELPAPGLSLADIKDASAQLLRSGADIIETNTIRKRLSAVKGGRFALLAKQKKITALILSDILRDRIDMIASGPVSADMSTCNEALETVKKYRLKLSKNVMEQLEKETPKTIANVETEIIGNVSLACDAAADCAEKLGYKAVILTKELTGEAKNAADYLCGEGRKYIEKLPETAFALITGGETVVKVRGSGKGGRNQEFALAAAEHISGMKNTAVFSFGTDGTDGPTDAAGGYVCGESSASMKASGISPKEYLDNNDSYNALNAVGGLILTGPTGTNVNDIAVFLYHPEQSP